MAADRPPDVHFEFDHDESAPRRARVAIDPLVNEPGDPIADDVHLAVSELVTNVVLHTDDGGVMEAWDPRPDVPLRLEVTDTDKSAVRAAEGVMRPIEQGGHGLHIVEVTSDQWGVEPTADGKKVWAEFDRTRRERGNG